jgi:hypothetical protein
LEDGSGIGEYINLTVDVDNSAPTWDYELNSQTYAATFTYSTDMPPYSDPDEGDTL